MGGIALAPGSDTIPIFAAQLLMIVSLGKVFHAALTQSAAKSLATVALAKGAGRTIDANLFKMISGVGFVAGGKI